MQRPQLLLLVALLAVGALVLVFSGLLDSEEPVQTPELPSNQQPVIDSPTPLQGQRTDDRVTETRPFEAGNTGPEGGPTPTEAETEAVIDGVVVSPEGPVEGAMVELFEDRSPLPGASQVGAVLERATSDAEGRFQFTVSLPARRTILQARHPDYTTARVLGLDANDRAARKPILEVREGAGLEGSVFHADGRALEGARVRIYDLNLQAFEPENRLEKELFADADGKWKATGLLEGLKMVEAWYPGCTMRLYNAITVPRQGSELRFTLEDGRSITGRVVYEGDQQPAFPARVVARPARGARRDAQTPSVHSAQVDEFGAFEIVGLSEGSYDMWAQGVGHLRGSNLTVGAGATDVVLTVQRPITVSGRVLSKGDQTPITSFRISAVANPMMPAMPGSVKRVKSEDGSFTLDNIPAWQQMHLVVEADGRPRTIHGPLRPAAGEVLEDVFVEVGLGGVVQGIVLGFDGKAQAGVTVEAIGLPKNDAQGASAMFLEGLRQARAVRQKATTDGFGRYVFTGLIPGTWTFSVKTQKEATQNPIEVDLQPDEVREIDPLRLTPAASLHVYLMTDKGDPDSAGAIRLRGVTDPRVNLEVPTDPQGLARFDGLLPGEYTVVVSKRAGVINLGGLLPGMASSPGSGSRTIVLSAGATEEIRDL